MHNECGHCEKRVAPSYHAINSHMQDKHGEPAEMGPDFRYYRASFVEEIEQE